jgi:predicted nucleic acid-binding protein
MRKVVVVDNAALINLTILKDFSIFNLLKNLFFQIHIPTKVKSEYEFMLRHKPERAWLLERLKPNTGFYSFCTRYDSIVLCTIQTVKDIDAGEAEAVAQFLKVNANYILSDDHRFTVALKMKEPNIKVLSTLHILQSWI